LRRNANAAAVPGDATARAEVRRTAHGRGDAAAQRPTASLPPSGLRRPERRAAIPDRHAAGPRVRQQAGNRARAERCGCRCCTCEADVAPRIERTSRCDADQQSVDLPEVLHRHSAGKQALVIC